MTVLQCMRGSHFPALPIMILCVIMAGGCRPAPAPEEPDEPELEEMRDIPSGVAEVIDGFWGGFAAADRDGMVEYMSEDLKDQMRSRMGLRALASEHHITHDSCVYAGFQDLNVTIEAAEESADRVFAVVVIEHPQMPRDQFAAFTDAFEDEVLRAAHRDREVDFRAEFSALLDDWEVPRGKTRVSMVLARERNGFTIINTDAPNKLFSSFQSLHQTAVCDGVHDARVTLEQGEQLDVDTRVSVEFRGERIMVQNAHLPECALDTMVMDIAGQVDLSVERLLEALADFPFDWEGLQHYLQMGPKDFLHSGQFIFDSARNQLALAMSRPYAVATRDTAVGVVDVPTGEVNFLDVVPGTVDFLSWSPDDEYLACAWTEWGPGFVEVDVYLEDDTMRLTEALGEELTDPIDGMRWSDDGDVLHIDVRDAADDIETWSLDVRDRDLRSK